jgi:quinone-modifying oxidoreductase subunit QmoC
VFNVNKLQEPDLDFIRYVKKAGGADLKKCYQCATCSVVCELSPEHKPFPRKEMIWAAWGQKDRLIKDPDVWLCHQCNDCTTHCPRGARPGDVLAAVRSYVFNENSFPRFMGRALASPKALPILFLVPIIVIGAIMFGFADFDAVDMSMGAAVDYNNFIRHGWTEGLFIGGNILIFAFAAVGLIRFWKGLKESFPDSEGPGFIPSAIKAVKEIITHENFGKCVTNKPRQYAHFMVLFGFLGSMATAGLALLWTVVLGHHSPIDLPNLIKVLGTVSGLALLIGLAIIFIRRFGDRDKIGANGYSDWLFLYILAAVGFTGLILQFLRMGGLAAAAYITYFIHLVFVFFLLWYAPYSKFAHMFYRTLAMIYAKSIDRKPRE